MIEKKSKIDDLFSAIKKEIEGRKKEEKRKTKTFFFCISNQIRRIERKKDRVEGIKGRGGGERPTEI